MQQVHEEIMDADEHAERVQHLVGLFRSADKLNLNRVSQPALVEAIKVDLQLQWGPDTVDRGQKLGKADDLAN